MSQVAGRTCSLLKTTLRLSKPLSTCLASQHFWNSSAIKKRFFNAWNELWKQLEMHSHHSIFWRHSIQNFISMNCPSVELSITLEISTNHSSFSLMVMAGQWRAVHSSAVLSEQKLMYERSPQAEALLCTLFPLLWDVHNPESVCSYIEPFLCLFHPFLVPQEL